MKSKNSIVCGVGINDADYIVKFTRKYKDSEGKTKSELIWTCPIYSSWKRMIERVYSKKNLEHRPTYANVTITPKWLMFSNFREWVLPLGYYEKSLVLDKDILSSKGNKIYSPETCAFVTKRSNSFVLEFGMSGKSNIRRRTKNCYEARVSNPILGQIEVYYSNLKDDCLRWVKDTKTRIASIIAESEPDPRIKVRLPELIKERYK